MCASSQNWTQEKCLSLIDEYEKRGVLWDPKHRNYFRKVSRQRAWQQVSTAIGMDPTECRKKIATMTACMRREKRKVKKSIKEGANPDEMYTSSWYAFDRMKFLYDKDMDLPEEIRSYSAGSKDTTTPSEGTAMEQEDENEWATTVPTATTILRDHLSGAPVVKSEKTDESNTSDSGDLLAVTTNNSNIPGKRKVEETPLPRRLDVTSSYDDEELRDFGNFVAKKLRKYNELTRSCIQNEITAIFLNADRGYYNQTDVSPGAVGVMPNSTVGELVLPNNDDVDAKCFREKSNGDYSEHIHLQHMMQ